ncbi:hypothetical protein BAE44_0021187 [Dichanthelium oligosanthes]|uniref:DUF2921 domain-containing protein n=1 Tax=Dichanthelium oligosanthes TaxID=888268 RepID=A0A1E5UYE4_9POAL|nr:hypothetical protein BAE44_0021187 [Dichanthelium oligosanthes]
MLLATIAATVSQLRYIKSHTNVMLYISLAMLSVQALGYSATLVTDAKMLPAWPTRRYRPYLDLDLDHLGWNMDSFVKALTLAALLLMARLSHKATSMGAGSKIVTTLLLNLALFLPCLSATRFADVERHCQSVLSSAAELRPDTHRDGILKFHLSFMNGDWSQDAGQAPLLPFHGSHADAAAAGPELFEPVPLASFMLFHMDTAPRRGAPTFFFNVTGMLSFTITHNCCCSYYMEPRASQYFGLWPGVARLLVQFQGVYTETRSSGRSGDDSGGERVLCMVGDAALPVPCTNSADNRAKNHGGDGNFKPPVVADGNILLLLRYPKTRTLANRAVRGEMMSTSAKSDGAYFDTVRLVSQVPVGYDSGYQFQPEAAVVTGCSDDDPLFHGGGDAMDMEHLNSGASLCSIVDQSAPNKQVMELIPNLNCKGSDAFCSRVGPFESSRLATSAMEDTAFTHPAMVLHGLQCERTSSIDGTIRLGTRVAAVFRYVPPWEDLPTAANRTGLNGMTMSAEGVWNASTGRVCMVGCLGVGNEACHYRVTLSVRKTFSMTRRGNIAGKVTAVDGSHAPLLFQQRVSPRFGRSWASPALPRMSYVYTKVEKAGELLRRSQPSGFRDSFVARSLLSYPNIAGAADDMPVSLSNLADDLNLCFRSVAKLPFVPEWIEEQFFELQILSIGTLVVGSYSHQFQRGYNMRMEQLGGVNAVHGVEKQQILNVSAELTASRNFLSPSPVMSLEGVYNPEDGRMYLIGCRNVHAPWRVLSKRRDDLEDGMDCSIEVTVEYPPTIARWLMIRRAARVAISSTREEEDNPLHFASEQNNGVIVGQKNTKRRAALGRTYGDYNAAAPQQPASTATCHEMALKWNDGRCFRAIWLCLAAWGVYCLLASPNKPGFEILVQVVEVLLLLAAIFLAALAQMVFCPAHIVGPRREGDAAVLPLVDNHQAPHVIDDDDDELPNAQPAPAQCTANARVEADVTGERRPVVVAGSYEHGG